MGNGGCECSQFNDFFGPRTYMFTFCGERNDRDFEKNMFSQETGFMRWWVLFHDGFMIVSAVILLKYVLIRSVTQTSMLRRRWQHRPHRKLSMRPSSIHNIFSYKNSFVLVVRGT